MFQHYFILAMGLLYIPVFTTGDTISYMLLSLLDNLEELPSDVLQLLLTISSAFIILVTLVIIFLRKRRKMNTELKLKTEEVERANRDLEKLNRELLEQKERIARELANSEMLYSIMLDSADDGIIFYNTDWSVKFANPALYSIVGYDQKDEKFIDIINDGALLHPDNSNFHTERSEAISQNGFFETEIKVKHKNGKYVVLSIKMVEVKDEKGSP